MRRPLLRAGLLACLATALLPASPSSAHDFRAGDLVINHPWSRAVGARAPTAAGYMSIVNRGSAPDRLISAETPMAESVEAHEMSMTDGVMRMRPMPEGIPLPPGGTAWLRPGGMHLMLVGPTRAFVPGERVPLTLRFERAGAVTVELEVATAGARAPAGEHRGD